MKRFPKLIVTLLVLAMAIGIFAALPVSAANDYEALRLKVSHLTAGHYTTTAMDGEIVQHSANKNYKEEIMQGFGHGEFLRKHQLEICEKIRGTLQ